MGTIQIIVKILLVMFAALSAFMWWRSATIPDGKGYDYGDGDNPDPYLDYYKHLKWWRKQFFSITYPDNQFFVNDIIKDFNRYAAIYACIATVFSIIDSLCSFATQ